MKTESSDYEKKVFGYSVRENEEGKESQYIRGEEMTVDAGEGKFNEQDKLNKGNELQGTR